MAFTYSLLLLASVAAQSVPPVIKIPSETIIPVPGTTPQALFDYHFTFPNLPEQVNPFAFKRGPQSGYNICNSTTEGPNSQCQTSWLNNIADFCLWGSPTAEGQIGDVEAAVVAYCSQPGRGTRVMPAGTLTAVQFIRTPAYIQVTGLLNQEGVGLLSNDTGGELDPHGDDGLGNPLGGLVFSNGLPSTTGTITQGDNWNLFIGSGTFCFKVCDNSVTTPNYCQNVYDLLGCNYNMPASYTPDVFLSCDGDVQLPVGVYVGSNGETSTFKQVSPLPSVLPYTPVIPASSNCVTYASSALYSAETGSVAAPSSSASVTASGSAPSASGGVLPAPTSSPTPTTSAKSSPATKADIPSILGLVALIVLGAVAVKI